MDQKIQNLTAAADLMERDRDQIALLHSAIPDKAEPNHYVQQLEALSQQNNLALVGVNIGPAKILGDTTTTDTAPSQNASVSLGTVPGGAKGVAASIDVSGEFSSLSNFFSQVQSMRRPMFLDSFLFSTEGSKKDPTQKPVIIFTILGQAPYYNNGK